MYIVASSAHILNARALFRILRELRAHSFKRRTVRVTCTTSHLCAFFVGHLHNNNNRNIDLSVWTNDL